MSTKVNGETRERLGQSVKRSAAVRGQADVCPGWGRAESRDFLPARFRV